MQRAYKIAQKQSLDIPLGSDEYNVEHRAEKLCRRTFVEW